ncbi:MAG: AAA family ATPase [Acidimicrobiales bacterium]
MSADNAGTEVVVGGPEFTSRPREDELPTRKPMGEWDRVKMLVLLLGLWGVTFWTTLSENPIISALDAVNEVSTSGGGRFLMVLIVAEILRQLHYILSENSPGWHRFWKQRVFGRINARTDRMNSWTRFRLARVVRWTVLLTIVAFALGRLLDRPPFIALFEAPARAVAALPMIFQFALLFFVIIIQFVGMAWYAARQGIEVYFPDDIKTRFDDVWGQDHVLNRIRENILFLENPESIESKGGYVPAGILLWGPPGTGKTLMAEAVAGETGKPYVFVDPGGLTSFGFGALAVKGVFRRLRKLATRYGGVIVFFDEADSLGSRQLGGTQPKPAGATAPWDQSPACNGLGYLDSRTVDTLARWDMVRSEAPDVPRSWRDGFFMMGGMGGGGMLQALLTELSGLKKPRGFMNRVVRRALGMRPKPPPKYRILVMMATNLPQALDEALLRPGRIDRVYKVGYPSKPGRIRTYEGYFAKVRHELTAEDLDKLATITPYATGAIMKDIVNEALIQTIREGREVITWNDVMRAKQFKALGPPEDVEYIERERHAVAVHEACHAVAAYRVRRHLTIDIATIEKGGNYLGMVASIPPEDQFTRWRSEYEADVMVALASLAGERYFFAQDNSSGVSGDLEAATNVVTLMEGYWGMGASVASHGVTHQVGIGSGGRPGARGKGKPGGHEEPPELLSTGLGERIEEKLAELLARVETLLRENQRQVLAVAHALETYKTISGDDVAAVIEGRAGPLVDGAAYTDPGFAAVIDAYHEQVVAAHRDHGQVDVPLPRVAGACPDAIAAAAAVGVLADRPAADGQP